MTSVLCGAAIVVVAWLGTHDSGSATHRTRVLVSPSADPGDVRPLRGAEIGERARVTVETDPDVKRVAFFVDDVRADRPAVASRTIAPFALDWRSRGGRKALSPGRHLLVAQLRYRDGSVRTARAAYSVERLYLAPGGSDSGDCSRTEPCASFRRGFSAARGGQVVEAAGGSYPCDDISGNGRTGVVIRAAEGAVVSTGCSLEIRARGVRLERVNVSGTVTFLSGADGSSFADGSAAGFNIYGADDVTVSGSTFDGQGQISNNRIWDEPAGDTPDRFRVLGNTIRNFYGPTASDHSEGIFVGYSTDGLIEGNTFENNGNTAHVFFSYFGGQADASSSYPRNICVRGNTFGATQGAYSAIGIRSEIPASTGIDVEPSPSNTLTNGLRLSSSQSIVRRC